MTRLFPRLHAGLASFWIASRAHKLENTIMDYVFLRIDPRPLDKPQVSATHPVPHKCGAESYSPPLMVWLRTFLFAGRNTGQKHDLVGICWNGLGKIIGHDKKANLAIQRNGLS